MTHIALVSGGSGFIGSHLVEALCKNGYHVVNIDIKEPPFNPKGCEYYYCDLREEKQVRWIFEKYRFDVVFHLGALPLSKVSDIDWWITESQPYWETNVKGTYNILKQRSKAPVIFTSSANIYGNGRRFTETNPFQISSPYGLTKAIGESLIQYSSKPYVIFRLGTVVGERGRCFPNRLVWCAVNGEPVEIWNNGNTWRSIIDVNDVVRALMYYEKLEQYRSSLAGIYNVATWKETCGVELVEVISEIGEKRGHKLETKFVLEYPYGYCTHSTLDYWKLRTKEFIVQNSLQESLERLFDYYEGEDAVEPPTWNDD